MDGGSSISELGIAGTSAALDNATNTTVLPDYCTVIVPEITEVRFWLVTVFGSTISIISVVENLFLFFLFITRRHHRTTYNMYMMLLAFFDVFVSMAYIFLMSMNVLTDYLQSVPLVRAWFWYMAPMLTISHIAITSSTLIIMAATYERFCITTNSTFLPFVQRYRKRIAAGMILLGVFSKGSIYFEFKIIFNEECQGLMSEISLTFVDWVHDTPYHTVFRFWYRNFATIFVPFFILAYLNIRIVRVFTTHQKKSYCADVADSLEKTKRKATARAATRTLVFVVCTYLISNIINVLLTVWEHIDKTSLDEKYMSMYAITLDIVSLLTNIACATRLPIYLTCQPTLRAEVFAIFKLITGEMHTSNKAGRANGDKQSLICANNAVNRAAMQPGWNISDGNGQFIKDVPKFGSVDGRTPVFLTVHQNENGETNNNMTPRIVFEESTETLL